MQSVVFGISTRDVVTFTALPAAIAVAAVAACVVPAVRAARVDPARAMQAE
jgi:ABC-type lipoprotein release transport system permease subunit